MNDPIEITREDNNIEFYFVRPNGWRQWFYEVHSLRKGGSYDLGNNEWWNEHLSHKIWYTPEIREKVVKLMEEIVDKK